MGPYGVLTPLLFLGLLGFRTENAIELAGGTRFLSHLVGEGEEVAFFCARVGTADIDGVWRISGDEVTLMVRPLDALLEAVKLMRQ